MKKLVLLIAVVAISAQAFSQMFVGGSLSFGSSKSKNESSDISKSSSFTLAPKFGYYLNEQFALGASIGIETGSRTYFYSVGDADDRKYADNLTTIAPFIRYHFMEIGNLSLFAEPTLSIGFGSSKVEVGGEETSNVDVSKIGLYVVPAVSYKINDNIDIEASFGYLGYTSYSEKEGESKYTTNNINLSVTDGLSLGFIYKF